MLNLFSELGSVIHKQFSTNNFFSGAVMGGAMIGAFHYLRGYPHKFYTWILERFCVIILFDSTDDVYAYIQMWLHHEVKFDRFKKHYRVISRRKQSHNSDDDLDFGNPAYEKEEDELEFLFTPYTGTYIFKYHHKWLKIDFERQDKSGAGDHSSNYSKPLDKLTIKYLGRNTIYAKEFLEEITRLYKLRTVKDVHTIIPGSSSGGQYWEQHSKLIDRPKESLILKDSDIDMIINDLNVFRDKQTERWYIEMGIPYHRGYLFYGPPGTGKSSTAYILASHFHMDIHFLNISKTINDNDFLSLVSTVSNRSFLVIEDVDCLFTKQRETKDNKSISFNTVLNALDGFCAKHGNIVIITTNHPEKLDKALLRPGRIDLKVHFDYFNQDQMERLFLKFFPTETGLAKNFAKSLESNKYSGAQIQEFLMRHRNDAQAALTDTADIDTILGEIKNEQQESKSIEKISTKKRATGKRKSTKTS